MTDDDKYIKTKKILKRAEAIYEKERQARTNRPLPEKILKLDKSKMPAWKSAIWNGYIQYLLRTITETPKRLNKFFDEKKASLQKAQEVMDAHPRDHKILATVTKEINATTHQMYKDAGKIFRRGEMVNYAQKLVDENVDGATEILKNAKEEAHKRKKHIKWKYRKKYFAQLKKQKGSKS